jgi:UDP-N-acetylglucosamine 2-epimerase (non-hydrolysing)
MPDTPRLLHVVGARPNFMKAAAVMAAARAAGVSQRLVHTGQHYDDAMSEIFLAALDIPEPDVRLGVGSGTHAEQTARIMTAIEPVLLAERPEWVVVYGDVNSTIAAALVAAKLQLRIAHVEAGLRSHDRAMPEEINRLVTDQLADLCLTPSRYADEQLRREGVPDSRIRCVGNVMVDTLLRCVERARALPVLAELGVRPGEYAVATLHRAGNVDVPETLEALLLGLGDVAARNPVVLPLHPRTRARVREFGLERALAPLRIVEPVGYFEMVALVDGAALVVTDSGGLQQETTVLGVPCLSVRRSVEWIETVTDGTNRLVEPTRRAVADAAAVALAERGIRRPHRPEFWDGHASERIVAALTD